MDDPPAIPYDETRQRRYFAFSVAAFAMMLLAMGAAMTVTAMGGIPEQSADGARVLNNHGAISPAGDLGWLVARAMHITSLALLAIVFALGVGCILNFHRHSGWFASRRQKWIAVGIGAGGLGLLLCWVVVLGLTGLGPWLARLS